jgi:Xaa-Pro aminopeptidase
MPTVDRRPCRRLGAGPQPSWLVRERVERLGLAEGLDFELGEYLDRHRRVTARMAGADLDAVLVLRPSSVRYLTGFHTYTWGFLPAVVLADRVVLCLTDDDLAIGLIRTCADELLHYRSGSDAPGLLAAYLREVLPDGATVGLDVGSGFVPPVLWTALSRHGLTPVDAGPVVEHCRLVLSAAEQDCLRRAAEHTARGLRAAVAAAAEPGATDSTIAAAVFTGMASASDSLARGQVAVAAGWRSGITHASWRNEPISEGSAIFLEFAGSWSDYCAPIIRTLCRGEPAPAVSRLDEQARAILAGVLDRLKAGVPACDVADAVAAEVGPIPPNVFFHENYGYPVGLAQRTTWMDGVPFYLVRNNPEPVLPGMAFHIPAALIQVGEVGVGHSHTVLVGEDGLEVVTADCGDPELLRV